MFKLTKITLTEANAFFIRNREKLIKELRESDESIHIRGALFDLSASEQGGKCHYCAQGVIAHAAGYNFIEDKDKDVLWPPPFENTGAKLSPLNEFGDAKDMPGVMRKHILKLKDNDKNTEDFLEKLYDLATQHAYHKEGGWSEDFADLVRNHLEKVYPISGEWLGGLELYDINEIAESGYYFINTIEVIRRMEWADGTNKPKDIKEIRALVKEESELGEFMKTFLNYQVSISAINDKTLFTLKDIADMVEASWNEIAEVSPEQTTIIESEIKDGF